MPYQTLKKTGLAQADGAQEFDLSGWEESYHHQIQITVSATPTAGTLTVAAKTPGCDEYADIGTIDMTGSDLILIFDCFAEAIRITPASFDAAKTYGAYLFSREA